MRLARFITAAFLVLSGIAHAALPGDATGMWFDARHPGWGLGVMQQNDSAFATLFTYDTGGMPVWLVASRLQANGVNFDPCATMPLTGALYRTEWVGFGNAANPAGSVHVDPVGTLTISVVTAPQGTNGCDRNKAVVQYTLDGAQTEVGVTRLTWTSNQARLYGLFMGGLVFRSPAASCPDLNATGPVPVAGRQFIVNGSADDSAANALRLVWGTGIDTACEIRGAYSQGGHLGAISGTLACGPIGFLTPTGTIRLSSIFVSDAGFVGEVSLDMGSCRYSGSMSGARRP